MDFVRMRCKRETATSGRVVPAMAAVMLAALALGGCAFGGNDEEKALSAQVAASDQVFPVNYRTELLAFLRTYLNDPRGLQHAGIAVPVQREVSGRTRYVVCVRYSERESGGYKPARVRAVLYAGGRLDRLVEESGELCNNVALSPFPELEKLTR